MASSAAGYACLVYALSKLLNVNTDVDNGGIDLTVVARQVSPCISFVKACFALCPEENVVFVFVQGSGSACRSLYGGFVKWEKGTRADGLDSKAVQVAGREHWPEMEAFILIVCETEKDTPSTEGMQNSVATSPFLAYRAEHVRHMCS